MKKFLLNNIAYEQSNILKNMVFRSERAVELPIIKKEIMKVTDDEILEIGNVTKQYFGGRHLVIDKYDDSMGIINEDVTKIKLNKKFKLIISISTLEHIGFDEQKKEPNKIRKAIRKIRSLLEKGGKAVITIPLGYNHYADRFIMENENLDISILRKIKGNLWTQRSAKNMFNIQYNYPYKYANAVAILEIRK